MTLNLKRHEAETMAAEERSWVCLTCDTLVEEWSEAVYCRRCKSYLEDIEAGVFDRWDGYT